FGGEATKLSYRWLSKQKGFGRLRYDFLGIVTTMPELAKTEQEESEVFRKRTDNVRQPDTVRQV
ncbi:TPA: hypothetical protein ACIRG0_001100, partial [Streptococcus suis]